MGRKIESIKWFTSDHHFFHSKILEYESRPFQTALEMNDYLITKWNEKVQPEDQVYVIGDFSFGRFNKTAEIVTKLNGRKHLIWGNHDDFNRNRLLKIFDSVYDQAIIQISNSIRVKLSHFPYVKQPEEGPYPRHKKFRPYDEGHWLLHGHVHSRWKINEEMRCINVGVDVWDYSPVNHDQIISIIRKAENENITLPVLPEIQT